MNEEGEVGEAGGQAEGRDGWDGGDKPKAKLRLYECGNVKARLDVAGVPLQVNYGRMAQDDRAEPRLGSAAGVAPKLRLRRAPAPSASPRSSAASPSVSSRVLAEDAPRPP